jgi:hypothetical protein
MGDVRDRMRDDLRLRWYRPATQDLYLGQSGPCRHRASLMVGLGIDHGSRQTGQRVGGSGPRDQR